MNQKGVYTTTLGQCRYGLKTPDETARMQKRTRLMSNILETDVLLASRCDAKCKETENTSWAKNAPLAPAST